MIYDPAKAKLPLCQESQELSGIWESFPKVKIIDESLATFGKCQKVEIFHILVFSVQREKESWM